MLIQRLSFRLTLRRVELVKLTRQLFRDDVEIGKSFDLRLDRNSPPLLETREQRKQTAPNKSCAQLRSPSKQGVIARVWTCPLSPGCAQKSDCLQSAQPCSYPATGMTQSGMSGSDRSRRWPAPSGMAGKSPVCAIACRIVDLRSGPDRRPLIASLREILSRNVPNHTIEAHAKCGINRGIEFHHF